MTSTRLRNRAVFAPALVGGLMGTAVACGTAASQSPAPTWVEPSSYAYTLRSTEGERALIGTFRVTVRGGEVVAAAGLDESGRSAVEQSPEAVPTIGELLKELEQARRDGADSAEVEYAAGGHPARITLDRDENAIDDEAVYVISAYRPAGVR